MLKWQFLYTQLPLKHLNKNFIQKTLSGLFLADPEKWVHLVGPGVHLVGTLNILTFHAQGRVASAKSHMYMCTYMKGNYNSYRSWWEIFSLGCTIGHLPYFVKKFKNFTGDIFFTDFQNLKN